ncbi:hypothetical protein A176_002289 [Myxococcus hansupus]|uniref:Uncharacterized protein n=1 Tax=Pseudomyxococcus hansupus TaxID=1297742 RepID=A0A0H4XBQ2_9BACT|nr:hypothetical protein [Myxococcus hansupus]AKQ65377.1 hypothetical protein A176_002289 [Myxococcus hansupus]
MPQRRTVADVESILRSPTQKNWEQFTQALKALPSGVDPELAAQAALSLIPRPRPSLWSFGRKCQHLPAPVIRVLLRRLEADSEPYAYFLREAVPVEAPDEAVQAAWTDALLGLLDLDTTYGWGSKQRKAKFQALANNPVLLQAIQTAVVACEQVSLDMLAVLTVDASDASVDALIPHVERAVQSQGMELDRLEDLRKHARATPAMNELFARMEALLQSRRARSPALDLAKHLGFAELDTFWFTESWGDAFHGEEGGLMFRAYNGHIRVDSRNPVWFQVSLSRREVPLSGDWSDTRFDNEKLHEDVLGVGACEPLQLPAWIARAARQLGTEWDFSESPPRTNLRGKKRDRLAEWLRSGT